MDVRIRSGEAKVFPWGNTAATTATANQNSLPIYKEAPWTSYQAICTSTTFGALAATVDIQVSDDIWTGTGFIVNNVTLTNSSSVITVTASQFGGGTEQLNDLFSPPVAVGMIVVGPGIPIGTYVATVTNNNSITLSANVTGLATSPTVGSVRFFQTNWLATSMGTITLTGTTSATAPSLTDGFTTVAPWKFVRAALTNISGTGATVSVLMGD
jgi:hypothetical protein